MQKPRPILRQYLQQYTQNCLNHQLGSNRSRSRSRSRKSCRSSKSQKVSPTKQKSFEQHINELKDSLQVVLFSQQVRSQINKKIEDLYQCYLRDMQEKKDDNTKIQQIKSQGDKKSDRKNEYYYRLKKLRSKTSENIRRKDNELRSNENSISSSDLDFRDIVNGQIGVISNKNKINQRAPQNK